MISLFASCAHRIARFSRSMTLSHPTRPQNNTLRIDRFWRLVRGVHFANDSGLHLCKRSLASLRDKNQFMPIPQFQAPSAMPLNTRFHAALFATPLYAAQSLYATAFWAMDCCPAIWRQTFFYSNLKPPIFDFPCPILYGAFKISHD